MATQKPISTISFNTEPFLREKLQSLIDSHTIQCYMYIKHKGEDGRKDHIHLRIEPNKRIDPMDLEVFFREPVLTNPIPLCVRPFRPSKEEDWFLYAVHDEQYLKLKYGGFEKGEKLPYEWQDIVAPEYYDVEEAFIRAKQKLKHTSSNIASRLQNGEKPLDLIFEGENVHVINALNRAVMSNDYSRLQDSYAELNAKYFQLISAVSRAGYKMVLDPVTKEPLLQKMDPE